MQRDRDGEIRGRNIEINRYRRDIRWQMLPVFIMAIENQNPSIDSRPLLSRIANNAGVSEKSVRKAAYMMSVIKENSVTYGKDPNAVAAAVLYGACLAQGEIVSQVQLARVQI